MSVTDCYRDKGIDEGTAKRAGIGAVEKGEKIILI